MSEYLLEEIPCPFCGYVNSDQWESVPVTAWGEDGWVEVYCNQCGKDYFVREHVTRFYETKT